jgi:PHD/YefM family antitoxin component YafN of YafNO toxin-antitoxin module
VSSPPEVNSQLNARREVFETAAALADAVLDPAGRWSYESLREALLAGLTDGGLSSPTAADTVRRAAGELAAATMNARPRPHLRGL